MHRCCTSEQRSESVSFALLSQPIAIFPGRGSTAAAHSLYHTVPLTIAIAAVRPRFAFRNGAVIFGAYTASTKHDRSHGTLRACLNGLFSSEISMQPTSGSPPAKRVRAKAAAEPARKPTITVRKASSRKTTATAEVASSAIESLVTEPVTVDVSRLIETTAYFIAAQRNFTPGRELDDWLEAERRVQSGLSG